MRTFVAMLIAAVALCAYSRDYGELYEAGLSAEEENNLPLAISFYEEALKECPPDSVADVYAIRVRLRELNTDAGQFAEALRYAFLCVESGRANAAGSGPEAVMLPYIFVTNIYMNQGDTLHMLQYADTIAHYAGLPGMAHRYSKLGLGFTGMVQGRTGQWLRAADTHMRMAALERAEIAAGRGDRAFLLQQLNMAGNSYGNGNDFANAARAYAEQADSAASFCGPDSEEYLWARYMQANTDGFLGNYAEGAAKFTEVAHSYRRVLREQLRILPSEKRQSMTRGFLRVLRNMVPYGVGIGNGYHDFLTEAFESLMLTKGLLLASDRTTRAIIAEHGSDADRSNLALLLEHQENMRRLECAPERDMRAILDEYRTIKTLDSTLALSCSQYRQMTDFTTVTCADICRALGPGEVLLDFDDYVNNDGLHRYVCFELRGDMEYPLLHKVFEQEKVDSVLALENGLWSNLYSGEAAADMENIVAQRLDSIIGNAHRVYYVPSGIVHRLALEAIPLRGRLMGDTREFRRLSSARELVTPHGGATSGCAALFGALRYGATADSAEVSGIFALRNGLEPLPHSAIEIDSISAILQPTYSVSLYTGGNGTKESFVSLSGNAPAILHLSTHGFYYSPTDADRPGALQGYEDAMSLSGLAMTGEGDSGILTANEVAACDLRGTSIVSIASCHSGCGEVTPEGIYGLQRAFKKAGAGTLLLSLWEASDAAASLFMTEFYRAYADDPTDCHKAFQAAREAVRARYPNPFYWAPFVMVD